MESMKAAASERFAAGCLTVSLKQFFLNSVHKNMSCNTVQFRSDHMGYGRNYNVCTVRTEI